MSEKDRNEQVSFFDNNQVRKNTDIITEKLDRQVIENIRALQEKRNYEEELLASLHRLNSHGVCPGSAPTCDDDYRRPSRVEEVKEVKKNVEEVKEIHGADCHCSKCCPNPNPTFFEKHKQTLLVSLLWLAMIVLAVGWSPSGSTFDAIQESYVDLLVNFFKMAIFVGAGIVTYNLFKNKGE